MHQLPHLSVINSALYSKPSEGRNGFIKEEKTIPQLAFLNTGGQYKNARGIRDLTAE